MTIETAPSRRTSSRHNTFSITVGYGMAVCGALTVAAADAGAHVTASFLGVASMWLASIFWASSYRQ